MTDEQRAKITALGGIASQAAALCHFLSDALSNQPTTSLAAQAAEGIETLLDGLSSDLMTIADPKA